MAQRSSFAAAARTPPMAWAVLLGGLLLTFLGWRWVQHRVEEQASHVFDRQVELLSTAVRDRVDAFATILRSGAALVAAAPRVGRSEWATFVTHLQIDPNTHGIQGLELAERVAAAHLDRHVQGVRAEGQPDYQVHPHGDQSEYWPVVYVEPFNANQRALGYDLSSEPVRRDAGERARDSGTAMLSGLIQLVQDGSGGTRPAVLMLHPLYRGLPPMPTVAQRRDAFAGFVVAAFRTHDFMRGLLPDRMPGIDFEIFDGARIDQSTVLYDDDDVLDGLNSLAPPRFQRTRPIEAGGRLWTLRFSSLPEFERIMDGLWPAAVLAGGLLVSGLLFWAMRQQSVARARAVARAGEMTAELQAIFHAFPDVLVLLDTEGTILDFRGGRRQNDPLAIERLLGRRLHDLVPAALLPLLDDTLRTLRDTGQPIALEHALDRDGDVRHFEVRLLALRTERILVLARDISERVRADVALRRSQARLLEAERLGRTGNWHWDISTDRLSWSEGNCRLYGVDPDTFVPTYRTWLVFVHPDDIAASLDVIGRVYRERVTLSWDFRIVLADGEVRHLTCTGTAVSDATGTVTGLFGTTVDITARRQATEALRESELRFRQLADSIEEVFWIADLDPPRLLYMSPAYERVWGRPPDFARDDPLAWLTTVHPDDRARVVETHVAWIASGVEHAAEEFRILRPDGEVRWIRSTRTVVLRDDRGARRVGGVATDITAARVAQENHERLEARLRQAQKMEAVGTLAGGIAHDFNNVLGVIVGFTDLARLDARGNTAVLESLANVSQATERAQELVARMLAFARPQEPRRQVLALDTAVRDALKLARAALPASIDIRTHFPPGLPTVLADVTQIHQIVMNLASNAAHAMGERGGCVEITLEPVTGGTALIAIHPDLTREAYVRLSVRDSGPGMDAGTLERIFDPFFTTKAPTQGTGLGLSVVHGIVRGHGGAVVVESRPGAGATFDVYLPVDTTAPVELPDLPEETIPAGHGERVVFVDDEAALAEAGRRLLESLGYRVTVVTDPVAALAIIRADPQAIDAVISDLTMPNLSGIDLAHAVHSLRPGLPFVLTTGFGGQMTSASVRALGIGELLLKPTSAGPLARAVHRVLVANAASRRHLRIVRGP